MDEQTIRMVIIKMEQTIADMRLQVQALKAQLPQEKTRKPSKLISKEALGIGKNKRARI